MKTYVGKKQRRPYELIFHSSDTQDPETFLFSDIATAQRYLFARLAGKNDDAELRVIDVESGHVLGGYFYRFQESGKWMLLRALEIA